MTGTHHSGQCSAFLVRRSVACSTRACELNWPGRFNICQDNNCLGKEIIIQQVHASSSSAHRSLTAGKKGVSRDLSVKTLPGKALKKATFDAQEPWTTFEDEIQQKRDFSAKNLQVCSGSPRLLCSGRFNLMFRCGPVQAALNMMPPQYCTIVWRSMLIERSSHCT